MSAMEHIELSDGRRLEYSISGPADGVPLVFHHGTPGSRSPFRALERAAHARGLRLVCASRPGYGGSSPRHGRTVIDVVADTEELLKAIGADRCLVAGWSGGGPHALACAARLRGAAGVGVIAGVTPYEAEGIDWMAGMGEDNVKEFGAAVEGEESLRPLLVEMRERLKDVTVDEIVSALSSLLPDVDRAVLVDEYGEDVVARIHEALSSGVEGWLDDDLAFIKPWGFDLSELTIPIAIWQGSEDLMVPFAHGEWLAGRLPSAEAHLEGGEGHLSIGLGAIDRIVDELVRTSADEV